MPFEAMRPSYPQSSRFFSEEDLKHAQAWPFEEARKILKRIHNNKPAKGYVLLESGYGPSGLPHIGTFGEVARTIMVQHAFSQLSDVPTRLFAFSDDMDGLRKVPDTVPQPDQLSQHLGKRLTAVPDPYGKYDSFAHYNNAKLREFLDSFGFSYEFQSATDHYRSGRFDTILRAVLEHYDEIMALILPTLREERQSTYSPFLPVCPKTQKVLQVPILEVFPHSDTLVYQNPETQKREETLVTGGHCKLQWKVDWGARWCAFDVDYEMAGKDLLSSVDISSQICKILGGTPPETLSYELFLDKNGQKISKSKGNGLSVEEWLRYAPPESLSYYMFQAPRKAKRLHFDVIPRVVDDYIASLEKFDKQTPLQKLDNPVFHIHKGAPPCFVTEVSFSLLLNLASVCGAQNTDVLWGFVKKYAPKASPRTSPLLDRLIHHALAYFLDFVQPSLCYRLPTALEKSALERLLAVLQSTNENQITTESLQHIVYEVGKEFPFENLRLWFQSLYEILLGSSDGPRMGSFIALYGVDLTCQLIQKRLAL
jgi:lysyl-tRNA synthetase class 1